MVKESIFKLISTPIVWGGAWLHFGEDLTYSAGGITALLLVEVFAGNGKQL